MVSFTKYSVSDWIIVIIFSYFLVTILNVLIHMAFPQVEVLKTGFAFILLLVSIVLVMLFTVSKNGFGKEDWYSMLIVVAIMIFIYFAVRYAVPGLFSILPDRLKEVFSLILP